MGKTRAAKRATSKKEVLAAILRTETAFRDAMRHSRINRVRRGLWVVGYRTVQFGFSTSKTAAIQFRRDLRRASAHEKQALNIAP